MAAHAVTGLLDCIQYVQWKTIGEENREKAISYVWPAFNLGCWTEDIEVERFYEIYKLIVAKDVEGLLHALIDALPSAIAEWQEYGRPSTREEWHKAKWEK